MNPAANLGTGTPPDATDQHQQLCEVCQLIDFEQFVDGRIQHGQLGRLNDIFQKQDCPFCRLITHLLQDRWREQGYFRPEGSIDTTCCYLGQSGWANGLRLSVPLPLEERGYGPPKIVIVQIYLMNNDPGRFRSGTAPRVYAATDQVDLDLLRSRLHTCEATHDRFCLPSGRSDRLPKDLRLLDVQDNALILAPPQCRYFALSYVWGKARVFQTTMANCESLEMPGALLRADLPRVVRGAMHLVAGMGERYLWVDSLCIVQDSPANKHDQISRMDAIYNNACLTILAAAAKDASDGLPGIAGEPRRVAQAIETVKGLRFLASSSDLTNLLDRSQWNTRAWTYQERLLSMRRLYLFQEQAFFECQTSLCCEYLEDELPRSVAYASEGNETNREIMSWDKTPLWWTNDPVLVAERFVTYVNQYTGRQLSYPSDIQNAFAGMATVWQDTLGCKIVQGLPETILDHALRWLPAQLIDRRRIESAQGMGTPEFPSWSWTGWLGQVEYDDIPHASTFASEVSSFEFKRQESGSTTASAAPVSLTSFTGDLPPTITPSSTIDVLEFWSTSAIFMVSNHLVLLYEGAGRPHNEICLPILDAASQHCGITKGLDPTWLPTSKVAYECILLSRRICFEGTTHTALERRGKSISIRTRDDVRKHLSVLAAENDWPPRGTVAEHDRDVFETRDWSAYNVLIVQPSGEFVERVALGQIHEDAWKSAGPVKKLFRVV